MYLFTYSYSVYTEMGHVEKDRVYVRLFVTRTRSLGSILSVLSVLSTLLLSTLYIELIIHNRQPILSYPFPFNTSYPSYLSYLSYTNKQQKQLPLSLRSR